MESIVPTYFRVVVSDGIVCKRHRFRMYGIYLVVVMTTDFGVPVVKAFV